MQDGPSLAMRKNKNTFFTARPAGSGTRATEFAEEIYFLSAERAEKKLSTFLIMRKNHSKEITRIYSYKIMMLP